METKLKDFLEIPYDKLEELNLKAKEHGESKSHSQLEKEYTAYLRKEKRIKAVTLCFTDIEGRLHMLDYDKKFLLDSLSNLTFDGSSIRGFTPQHESDLRLEVDWASIRYMPSDVFGPGKVIFFASVMNRDRTPYISDFRGRLKGYTAELKKKEGLTAYAAPEIEGFVVDGANAEQKYRENGGFTFISSGGYFHSLPLDPLRVFIDRAAEAQRAMGFKNEKDHPEVAPSQFEMNFSYAEVVRAADNVQLYKLIARQVARNMGLTASFLPKPFIGINGSGMHTNFSLAKGGKNIFYDPKGADGLSKAAWDFILRMLNHASETCLVFNSSVNAYRRLDPHFEAPNQIKVSAIDRGSMIRIPVGNERTARIEMRSVAPDANPYLVLFTMLKVGLEGKKLEKDEGKRDRVRFLPDNIYDAIALFKASKLTTDVFGEESKEKYIKYKELSAERCPKALGATIKDAEIIYHHDVTNQLLWSSF
ncbi:glutamine synthetase [Candidatus Kaiserbacteria bacterium RIFCSPHIGHO2_02_FULL_59_21]|uniref:Glutamine synthetase n=1 Tax=Candidatus Kaiserbacteria bacterium RIFCSPHIGHO2_02_FULL_59_21 TaxID=1798500 RepID=A0A1F6DZM4_9BACT|nr:MAG: glutamine synthetase [Candidatus Kaiserbacteria bacterium RIFCSPHIGHO2_01_FULL_58_22]OGG66904.1 MAG: glutamine synthetase [Candidatus Kaiserbacteria bacterium RIFCSPHIGHO2_02_FULL_59_21]OGG80482.1 MAG: glutamine synthetase [Candidatus Kaiserbacteria bacterium RIFCSPLOWO2_01_FULL_59_34]OGG86628.1 MAG: glutamine synthetase [Candidatus Kaiserbacteria bacterium RIFCSPLOWO2_02_FULL_59_19]